MFIGWTDQMHTKYSVCQIPYEATKDWILNIHYAKRMPSISYAYGLYLYDEMVGTPGIILEIRLSALIAVLNIDTYILLATRNKRRYCVMLCDTIYKIVIQNFKGNKQMRVKKIRRHRDNEQTQFGNPVAKHSWKINRAKRFADKTKYDRKRKAPISYDLRPD